MDKVYSKEGILAQALIAFGQGMGQMRISHDAALKVSEHYSKLFDAQSKDILAQWETQGAQALERIRAVGRLVASQMSSTGLTAAKEVTIDDALSTYSASSDSTWCQ